MNLADFNPLAGNFGNAPRDFTQGDFDYSGNVNLNDFNILASRFAMVLAPAAGDAAGNDAGDDELPDAGGSGSSPSRSDFGVDFHLDNSARYAATSFF